MIKLINRIGRVFLHFAIVCVLLVSCSTVLGQLILATNGTQILTTDASGEEPISSIYIKDIARRTKRPIQIGELASDEPSPSAISITWPLDTDFFVITVEMTHYLRFYVCDLTNRILSLKKLPVPLPSELIGRPAQELSVADKNELGQIQNGGVTINKSKIIIRYISTWHSENVVGTAIYEKKGDLWIYRISKQLTNR